MFQEVLMITYCVICRDREESSTRRAPLIRFYLTSDAADRAILTAEAENPACRVLGIEPLARNDSQAA
jgi:hypothetical protein